MNINIAKKFAAVAMAVMMNAAIMGGVVWLFGNMPERPASAHRMQYREGAPMRVSAHANQLIVGKQRFPISI